MAKGRKRAARPVRKTRKVKAPRKQTNTAQAVSKALNKEPTWLGKLLRVAGGAAGTFVGAPETGYKLGAGFSKLIGHGDYSMSGGAISQPRFSRQGKAVIFEWDEFLTDVQTGPTLVNGQTAFDYNTYNLNPGLRSFAPVLSQMASTFVEYEWDGLTFEFRSTSANALNSTNTALGSVIMSTNYNANAAPYVDKRSQENTDFSISVKPSECAMHAVECKKKLNPLELMYVRNDGVFPTQDLRFSDLGKFQISTVGMQAANVVIGELWIHYRVKLHKPQVNNKTFGFAALLQGTVAAASPLGTSAPAINVGSSQLVTIDYANKNLILDKSLIGRCFVIQFQGSSAASNFYSFGATTGMSFPTRWTNGANSYTAFLNTYDSGQLLYDDQSCVLLGSNGGKNYVIPITCTSAVIGNSASLLVDEVDATISARTY